MQVDLDAASRNNLAHGLSHREIGNKVSDGSDVRSVILALSKSICTVIPFDFRAEPETPQPNQLPVLVLWICFDLMYAGHS